MSHRIYIYNVAKPTQSQQTDVMVSEWGYEVPLLLQALLVDGGFIDDNTYNNHVNFNNQGLYSMQNLVSIILKSFTYLSKISIMDWWIIWRLFYRPKKNYSRI